MLSLFKKKKPQVLQLTVSGNYNLSTQWRFHDLVRTIILTFLKSDSIVFDKTSMPSVPPHLNKDYLTREEAVLLFQNGLSYKDVDLTLWSKEFLLGTKFPEGLTLYRSKEHDAISLYSQFDSSLINLDLLNDFIENIKSLDIGYMCIEDLDYSLQATIEWEKDYFPSDRNNYKKGDEKLRDQSPYISIVPFTRIPWTASRYWFGDMLFNVLSKDKIITFPHARTVKSLNNGVVSVLLHENNIVSSDTTNKEIRASFRQHLNVEWPDRPK